MEASFSVSTQQSDGLVVVTVTGEFDLAQVGDFNAAVAEAARSAGPTVIDLSGCTFIDSSGLKAVLDAHRAAEGRGQRAVVAIAQPEIRRLFELTALHLTIPTADSLGDAINLLRAAPA